MEKLYNWVSLVGATFIAVVSVISAFFIENITLRILLIISAAVTLALVVLGILSTRKMSKRINKLEEGKQDKIVFASVETCESIIDELTR